MWRLTLDFIVCELWPELRKIMCHVTPFTTWQHMIPENWGRRESCTKHFGEKYFLAFAIKCADYWPVIIVRFIFLRQFNKHDYTHVHTSVIMQACDCKIVCSIPKFSKKKSLDILKVCWLLTLFRDVEY